MVTVWPLASVPPARGNYQSDPKDDKQELDQATQPALNPNLEKPNLKLSEGSEPHIP